jgi:hypothetical protein
MSDRISADFYSTARDAIALTGGDNLNEDQLWLSDTGVLGDSARRALLVLVRGPYLSFARQPQLWSALLENETVVRSRLSELFLDLVVDLTSEIAFVRNVDAPGQDVPRTVRTVSLTFLDSAMLLLLRQLLVDSDGRERVIVGREEVFEQLEVYKTAATSDDAAFLKRLNASWSNMKRYGIIGEAATEDRVEISPVLRLVFGIEQIHALREEYRRIASARGTASAGENDGSDDDGVQVDRFDVGVGA